MSALGLPARCDFTLTRCGAPMTLAHTRTSWQGKPGEATETTQAFYRCDRCSASLELTVVEPA